MADGAEIGALTTAPLPRRDDRDDGRDNTETYDNPHSIHERPTSSRPIPGDERSRHSGGDHMPIRGSLINADGR